MYLGRANAAASRKNCDDKDNKSIESKNKTIIDIKTEQNRRHTIGKTKEERIHMENFVKGHFPFWILIGDRFRHRGKVYLTTFERRFSSTENLSQLESKMESGL
ncbi:hypothetical protein AVEN_243695-1 [Araneus ventricosus]|uniref:Uncharacterized protein n=1 Tax=Araneus ventricosus TaxID=182803 RepID=A0A4Y2A5L6_ARAVE|nr:hypothetical protein AVEN_243695-1 [Araneus ventricosus]